jgi:hypothetical protein
MDFDSDSLCVGRVAHAHSTLCNLAKFLAHRRQDQINTVT